MNNRQPLITIFLMTTLLGSLSSQSTYIDKSFGKKGKLSFKMKDYAPKIVCDQDANFYVFHAFVDKKHSKGPLYTHNVILTKFDNEGQLVKSFGKDGRIKFWKNLSDRRQYFDIDIHQDKILIYDLYKKDWKPQLFDLDGKLISELSLDITPIKGCLLYLTDNDNTYWLDEGTETYAPPHIISNYYLKNNTWQKELVDTFNNVVRIHSIENSRYLTSYGPEKRSDLWKFNFTNQIGGPLKNSLEIDKHKSKSSFTFCGILSNGSFVFSVLPIHEFGAPAIYSLYAITAENLLDINFGEKGIIKLDEIYCHQAEFVINSDDNIFMFAKQSNKRRCKQNIYKLTNVLN